MTPARNRALENIREYQNFSQRESMIFTGQSNITHGLMKRGQNY
jgi:hypothetical protein